MKDRKFRALAIAALVIAVAGISVAFAALSQQLAINATGRVEGATWDVKWTVATGTKITGGTNVSAGTLTSPAVIGTGATSLTIENIVLEKPGDKIQWEFTASNAGTLDAKLANITKILEPTITVDPLDTTFNQSDIEIKFTKDGGGAITDTDTLVSSATQKYILTVEFKTSATVIPSQDVSIEINSEFPWVQN